MTDTPRKTAYLGCLGYNDSPDELGEPSGFWHFSDEERMWGAFARSQGMNAAFEDCFLLDQAIELGREPAEPAPPRRAAARPGRRRGAAPS